MSTDASNRFRLTTWPHGPLPVPELWVYPVHLTDEGFLERDLTGPRPKGGQRGQPVEVPDELYLRELRELDLGDPEAVAAFVAEYGPMGTEGWGDLPEPYGGERPVVIVDATFVSPSIAVVLTERYSRYMAERGLSTRPPGLAHVDDFGVYARLLRDLVRIVEASQGLLTLADVEAQWESAWTTPAVWKAGGMREAMAFVSECLARTMHPYFYARVEIRDADWPEDNLLAPAPTLYAVLCLQLWNHIAEQAEYRVCDRRDCRRLFVRQRGRAEFGQHRTSGVLYCSPQCARLVAVRSYRDEARKMLELHDRGLGVVVIAERMEWTPEKTKRKLRSALDARKARQGKAKRATEQRGEVGPTK